MSDHRLMTVREAAAVIGVAQATLRKWTAAGLVEATRTAGGHRRYRKEAIDAFIENALAGPGTVTPSSSPSYGAYRPVQKLLALPAVLFGGLQGGIFELMSALT